MSFFVKIRQVFTNGKRYIPLIENLVSRELKTSYRRSILGYFWCVLSPLLVMIILNTVFSRMFLHDIENYPVYLFSGRMIFSFITDSTSKLQGSFIHSGALMRKTYVPHYIFPLSTFCSSIVNFGFSFIAFAITLIFTGTPVSYHVLALPVVLTELFMFCFGFGLILSILNTRIRDIGYLYGAFKTGWIYLTPMFYPLEQLSPKLQNVIANFNPAYFYITQMREIFLYHTWPSPDLLRKGFITGAIFLILGLIAYVRKKDDLILYI